MQKIIVVLTKGPMNRTSIGLWCGLKYTRCSRHVDHLEDIFFIEHKNLGGRYKLFGLTERGMEYYLKRLKNKKVLYVEPTVLNL